MKLILSRKGLDSSFGSVASPILSDGQLCWLPIPEVDEKKQLYQYDDLRVSEHSAGKIIGDLSNGKIASTTTVHLDPDIFPFYARRDIGWHPLFGQTGAAEAHLRNYGVGHGDIFLFFGWFRRVELFCDHYRYVPHAPDLHVLYGWFQIERKEKVIECVPEVPWMKKHTHFQGEVYNKNLDTVYFPTKNLILNDKETKYAGCGYFPKVRDDLILTAVNQSRSVWKLPQWFYPKDGKKPLSYHGNISRWGLEDKSVLLKTVGRGQEFVLDMNEYPQSVSWLESIISGYGVGSL